MVRNRGLHKRRHLTYWHRKVHEPVSKKEWENMPLSRIKKPYREDLSFKANYFNPYSDRCYSA